MQYFVIATFFGVVGWVLIKVYTLVSTPFRGKSPTGARNRPKRFPYLVYGIETVGAAYFMMALFAVGERTPPPPASDGLPQSPFVTAVDFVKPGSTLPMWTTPEQSFGSQRA